MANFINSELGTLLDTIIDYRGKTPKKLKGNWSEIGIPALSAKNIKSGKIVNEKSIRYVDEKLYSRWMNKEVKAEDILMTSEAPLGETYFVKTNEKLLLSQRLFAIRANKNKIDPKYLYYYFNTELGKHELQSRATGTTVGGIRQTALFKVIVNYPKDIKTQMRIASVLSAYDDLIENNEKRIKILEEMAQRLYAEWFVKFKFPGHKKVKMIDIDTEYGMIPKGWEVKNVESLIKKIPAGKRYENKNVFESGKIPVLDQGKSGFIGYHNDEAGVKATIENPIIVFANHTCYQNIIVYPFSTIQNVLPFIPSDGRNIFWLHWATKDLIKLNDYKGHWPEFMSKKLIVPSIELAKNFGVIVGKYVAMKYMLESENNNLSNTLDLLIPQLMTGKRELIIN